MNPIAHHPSNQHQKHNSWICKKGKHCVEYVYRVAGRPPIHTGRYTCSNGKFWTLTDWKLEEPSLNVNPLHPSKGYTNLAYLNRPNSA